MRFFCVILTLFLLGCPFGAPDAFGCDYGQSGLFLQRQSGCQSGVFFSSGGYVAPAPAFAPSGFYSQQTFRSTRTYNGVAGLQGGAGFSAYGGVGGLGFSGVNYGAFPQSGFRQTTTTRRGILGRVRSQTVTRQGFVGY